MRLIDIHTQELHEFIGSQIPPYAILSHRWGCEELTFKEVFKQRIDETKRGYQKLIGACCIAAQYEVRYLWIDTCCIDKRSSAELSEAINSMFDWYKSAKICLAYLEDVLTETANTNHSFRESVWFTRCWTLQELLAPENVYFFSQTWDYLGNKHTRCHEIHSITGIQQDILMAETDFWIRSTSIAKKMSWAANRHATRSEDVAYSLMGMFDIHMPLLYGEGENAFIRLQEEIVRSADECSILLWGLDQSTWELFAKSPADFAHEKSETFEPLRLRQSFGLTNIGLEIETQLVRYAFDTCGIHIGMSTGSKSNSIILLVKKCPTQGYYHRVGIVDVPNGISHFWQKKQRLTVLRGTKQQRLFEHFNVDEALAMASTAENLVCIRIETTSSAKLDETESAFFNAEEVVRFGFKALSYVESFGSDPWCKLSPIQSETLRLKWQLKATLMTSTTLWLDFCFDFDSYPCLLLRRQTSRGKLDDMLRQISVKNLAEKYESGCWQDRRREVFKTEEQHPGMVSYFYRFEYPFRKMVEIPPELVPQGKLFWVGLYRHSIPGDPHGSWRLKITE